MMKKNKAIELRRPQDHSDEYESGAIVQFSDPATSDDAKVALPAAEIMLERGMATCAPKANLPNSANSTMNPDVIALKAAQEMYNNFAPRDAAEAQLVSLLITLTNTALTCFSKAALEGDPLSQDLLMRNGFRAASTVLKFVETLDRRRSRAPKKVTVGRVNVEAGGQAIVGNIESQPSGQHQLDETASRKRTKCR
jgi:hypothetical protein